MIKTTDIESVLASREWKFREATFEVFSAEEMWEFFVEYKEDNILMDVTLGGQGRYFKWLALIEKPEITFLLSTNSGIAELDELEKDCVKCVFWVPTSEIVILNVYAPLDREGWKMWYVGYIYWVVVKFCQNNSERFGITLNFFENEAFSDIYLDKDYVMRIHTER